ncbi:MAG: response regulator [Clostridiaceae bacterium]|nr:response regulator [Clostridiaceae bacterium]
MEDQINKLIILVEDSPEDYAATLRAFKKVGMRNKVIRFEMGDDCLDYLFSRGKYEGQNINLPGLIMLDLNLPGTDGREVLRIIKSTPQLNKIPVVVLTTSNDEKDIESCYEFGANSYIQKPVNFEGFINAITKLKEYWFEITILPK